MFFAGRVFFNHFQQVCLAFGFWTFITLQIMNVYRILNLLVKVTLHTEMLIFE